MPKGLNLSIPITFVTQSNPFCSKKPAHIFLDYILLEDFIAELFPEFIDMFDGVCWYEDGGKMKVLLGYTWWESGWKEPRIRILDTILQTW